MVSHRLRHVAGVATVLAARRLHRESANGVRIYPTTVTVRGAKAAKHVLASYPLDRRTLHLRLASPVKDLLERLGGLRGALAVSHYPASTVPAQPRLMR